MPAHPQILAEDDVAGAAMKLPNYGRRFSMDVAEEVLARMGREAIPYIAGELAKRVVYENGDLIRSTVSAYLEDRTWAAPIIEDELRKTVRRFAFDLLTTVYAGTQFGELPHETEKP